MGEFKRGGVPIGVLGCHLLDFMGGARYPDKKCYQIRVLLFGRQKKGDVGVSCFFDHHGEVFPHLSNVG